MDPTMGSATAAAIQATYPGPAQPWVGGKVVNAKEEQVQLEDERPTPKTCMLLMSMHLRSAVFTAATRTTPLDAETRLEGVSSR